MKYKLTKMISFFSGLLLLLNIISQPVYSIEQTSQEIMQNGNFMNSSQLFLDNDWLYYLHISDRWVHIYRMDLEGENLTPVDTWPKPQLKEMFVHQQALFYIVHGSWYRVDLMTLEQEEIVVKWKDERYVVFSAFPLPHGVIVIAVLPILEAHQLLMVSYEGEVLWEIYQESGKISNLNVSGDHLYFTDSEKGDKLIRCNLDGSDLVEITQKAVDKVMVHQGWIYFTYADSGGKLNKMKINEYKSISLFPHKVQQYNICNDWLFFSGYIPNQKVSSLVLYKMHIDGSELKRINDFPPTDIHVFDNKVFYRRPRFNSSEGLWMYDLDTFRHVRLDENPAELLPLYEEAIDFVVKLEPEIPSELEENVTPINDKAIHKKIRSEKVQTSPWSVLFFLVPVLVIIMVLGFLRWKRKK